jgi:hypothetical protein
MMRIPTYIILSFLIILLAFSCKKGSIETNYNPSLSVANNQVIAERAYSEVFNIFFMVVSDSSLKQSGSSVVYGAECTYSTDNGIKYIINYGHSPTACPDGKSRQGVITANLDQDFSETGAIATLSFGNYIVNKLKLAGENTISNEGMSAGALQSYQHEIPKATLTFIDSTSSIPYSWSSSKMFVHVAGSGSIDNFDDDIFEISGTSSGSDVNGTVFSAQSHEALGDYFNCRWIRTGSTLLSTPGLDVTSGLIEYIGADTCTNQVIYYFNGNPFYDQFDDH